MIRRIGVLLLAVSLMGCASKYQVDSYAAPTSHLDKQASFYVALPADGKYGATTYADSGAMTAQTVSSALLAHVNKTVVGTLAGEDLEAARNQAKQLSLSHVFLATILHWEERATEWSGKPDVITLKLAVYETESGNEISSTVTGGRSKWGTLGGDHPQDLLPEPIKQFVDPLF